MSIGYHWIALIGFVRTEQAVVVGSTLVLSREEALDCKTANRNPGETLLKGNDCFKMIARTHLGKVWDVLDGNGWAVNVVGR